MLSFKNIIVILTGLFLLISCDDLSNGTDDLDSVQDYEWPREDYKTIWGSSTDHILVGGSNGTVLAFSCSDWHKMDFPSEDVINAMWGNSEDNILAVGERGLVAHYDGNEWNQIDMDITSRLYDVWMSSDGKAFASGAGGTLMMYDGSE